MRRGKVGVKQHLVEHIPQLFAHVGAVARFDGVDELVTFLDEVFEKRFVSLFSIPRAPVVAAKARHHRDEGVELWVR